jgi:hypothetical protein
MEGDLSMKLKRLIATTMVLCSVIAAPLTAHAATHTHNNWGPTMYYGYSDEKPLPWEEKCVTRTNYNYHECLTCGYKEVWVANKVEMKHNIQNGSCIYCGLTYCR